MDGKGGRLVNSGNSDEGLEWSATMLSDTIATLHDLTVSIHRMHVSKEHFPHRCQLRVSLG